MRKLVVLLAGIAILGLVNYSIYQKEQLLAHGRVALLELIPVDPRSFMQGDYMALRFRLQQDATPEEGRDGYIVATVDDRGIARYQRMDKGGLLAANEIRLFYRMRGNQLKLGTNAFFFQEGDQESYRNASYAEARIDNGGQLLLVGLRDKELRRLGPPRSRMDNLARPN